MVEHQHQTGSGHARNEDESDQIIRKFFYIVLASVVAFAGVVFVFVL